MIDVDTGQVDPVTRRLEALAAEMQARFGDAVEVHRAGGPLPAVGGLSVDMTPRREGALALYWFDTGEELQSRLAVDWADGGNWAEAKRTPSIWRASFAASSRARSRKVLGPGDRSRVTVTLADGAKDAETGYVGLSGCLPRPGWKRLGRHIQYQPWDG